MKTKILFLGTFILFSMLSSAQENKFYPGLGLHSDFNNIRLEENSPTITSRGIEIFVQYKKKLSAGMITDEIISLNSSTSDYQKIKLLGVFAAYKFFEKDNLSTDLYFSHQNVLKNISSFNNFADNLQIRFYLYNSCFLGTGINYFKINDLQNVTKSNFQVTWQIGFNLYCMFRNKK